MGNDYDDSSGASWPNPSTIRAQDLIYQAQRFNALQRQQSLQDAMVRDQQRQYEYMKRWMMQNYVHFPSDDHDAKRKAKFDKLPTATQFGELIGWRSWKIAFTDAGARLRSSYKDTIWPSGYVTSKDGAGNSVNVMNILHDAGWFAYKTASQLAKESEEEDVRVGGKVELWGAVVEHEKGYRAECMKIITLEAIGPRAALVIEELRDFYLKGN